MTKPPVDLSDDGLADFADRERYRGGGQPLFDQLQMVISGHNAGEALNAVLDTLIMTIAYSATDIEQAECVIEELATPMKQRLRELWGAAQQQRARAPSQGSTRQQ